MPLSFNKTNRQEFLNQVEESDYKKQLEEKARLEALQKLKDQGLGQEFSGGYANAPSLNKRRYGPYELTTILDQNASDGNKERFGQLINTIKKIGPEHSQKDAEVLAKELKDIDKPVDPTLIKGIMGLTPDSEYLISKTKLKENTKKPMWYDEEE